MTGLASEMGPGTRAATRCTWATPLQSATGILVLVTVTTSKQTPKRVCLVGFYVAKNLYPKPKATLGGPGKATSCYEPQLLLAAKTKFWVLERFLVVFFVIASVEGCNVVGSEDGPKSQTFQDNQTFQGSSLLKCNDNCIR